MKADTITAVKIPVHLLLSYDSNHVEKKRRDKSEGSKSCLIVKNLLGLMSIEGQRTGLTGSFCCNLSFQLN
jgi:hypothetical protein